MKKLFIIMLLLLSVSVYAEKPEELLDVPPMIHGVWRSLAYSTDGGATPIDGGNVAFLRMYATKAVMADGTTRVMKRVQVMMEEGVPYIILHPANLDSYWIVSDKGNDTILVQVWSISAEKETVRFLFKVVQ